VDGCIIPESRFAQPATRNRPAGSGVLEEALGAAHGEAFTRAILVMLPKLAIRPARSKRT
jgi:hypothetical protein